MNDSQQDLTKSAWSVGSHNESRAGRMALVLGLLLLGAAAAEAQTPRILVSNSAQGPDDSADTSGNDHAQLFHTGGATGGYILTSVRVNSEDPEDDAFDVEVCEADTSANEFPTSTCTALTAPGDFTLALPEFTHAGIALSANTNYVVVIKERSSANVELNSTTSSGEDTSLGLSDWSIKNYFYWNNSGTWTNQGGQNEALRIIVNGYAVVPVVIPPVVTAGQIWSATLTVGTQTFAGNTLYGWDDSGNYTGANLTDEDFSFAGDTYDMDTIWLGGGSLTLGFDPANAGDIATQATRNKLTLYVGSTSFNLGAGTLQSNQRAIVWSSTGLDWSTVTTVALQITEVEDPPDVTSVELVPYGTPTSGIGVEVETLVFFSAAVDVTGTPQLELDFAGTPKAADCGAATNTTTMLCSYTVVVGDSAPNGIAIAANKLTLNGGTITATGSTTNTADLAHAAVAIDAGQKVDGIRPTLVTTGSESPTTSTDGTQVILTFSENLGSVDRTKITIRAGGNVVSTSAAIAAGTKVFLELTTALTSPTVMLTVALAANAAEDTASNGNLAVAATSVTNALGAPDVPRSLSATPGNRQVMLSWVQPSGGAEVTDYEYEQNGSGTWTSTGGTATSYTVRNLTNGQPYTFKVRAVNSAGQSAASTASASVTPATEPGAPTGLSATVSDQGVDLSWTAPANNGGQSITDYEYEQGGSGIWISTGGTATSYTVTGLTNGQPYRFRVRAVNSVGAGAASAASPNVTPATEPDAPTGLSATVSDQRVDLSWTAPANNGGATILRYEYELDFSSTWTSTGSTTPSTTVRNLTNGQSYTFQVRAVNRVGAGPASGSQSATPTATLVAPDTPHSLNATPGNRRVRLGWVQPSGGAALTHYEYELDGSGIWISTGGTDTRHTVTGLNNGQTYTFRVRAVNTLGAGDGVTLQATPSPSTGGGGGGGGPRETPPGAPTNLRVEGGDGQVTLSWDAPEDDGGAAITDYEVRIDGKGEWISIGSTGTTHTVTGLVNGTEYTFEVRAVNRNRKGRASNRVEATPRMPVALDFAHFANGAGITSEMVFVNLSTQPAQPILYFYDQDGHLMDPEAVVDITGDLVVTGDGSLTVQTEMEPLGELTITTHGRGELVSGSVKVVSDGPIGGLVRYSVSGVGVAGVGASTPVRDVLFLARRQAGGIRTAAAIHNLGEEAMTVSCRLISAGGVLEEVEIYLEANGQTAWFIEDTFTTTGTADFTGSVRCTAPGRGRFTAIAVEMDTGNRIFTTLPVVEVNRGRAEAATLDFAHFANGTWITDLVFVNLETRTSGPPLTPYHTAIPPTQPVLYFYDKGSNLIDPASVVDITGDLEVTGDGALTVRTEMEPLGVLTISTHGRGDLASGSVRVISDGPIGGMLRFDHPDLGVAGVGASLPVGDALFPVRRQEGGISTAAAIHNLGEEAMEVSCRLMQEGIVLEEAEIPLMANGQEALYIEQMFTTADTSAFVGSVRCRVPSGGKGMFTAGVLEMDPGTRTFVTVPVFPVPEMPSRE